MHRVDGIVRLGKMHLDVADSDLRIITHSFAHPFEAYLIIEEFLLRLERIERRHDKPQFVDRFILAKPVGNDEMTDMDGIERSEIDADVLH